MVGSVGSADWFWGRLIGPVIRRQSLSAHAVIPSDLSRAEPRETKDLGEGHLTTFNGAVNMEPDEN